MMSKYQAKQRREQCERGHENCALEDGGQCGQWLTETSFISHLCDEFRTWLREYVNKWSEPDYTDAQERMNEIAATHPKVNAEELRDALDGMYTDFEQDDEVRREEEDMEEKEG